MVLIFVVETLQVSWGCSAQAWTSLAMRRMAGSEYGIESDEEVHLCLFVASRRDPQRLYVFLGAEVSP